MNILDNYEIALLGALGSIHSDKVLHSKESKLIA